VKTFLIKFLNDERGSISVEYSVVLPVVVAINIQFSESISRSLSDIANNISMILN
jgi:Flp pilus assembly pilin Flp